MKLAVTIFQQIVIMFLYMAIGWMMAKRKLITKEGSRAIANLLLYVILPCVIVKSFCLERTPQNVTVILLSFCGAAAVLLIAILISHLLFKKRPLDNFGAAFSNAGFMGIPLISSALGAGSVLYVVPMIAILNALQWTYGQAVISGKKEMTSPKKVLGNPIVAALVLGMGIFFLKIPVPKLVYGCMETISYSNAPVAMIILGVYLAEIKAGELLSDAHAWFCSAARLVIIPAVTFIALKLLFPGNSELGKALLIAAAAPVGSNVAVYAQRLDQDYPYAVKTVCLSTLLSVVTMPLFVLLFQLQ